MLTDAHFLAVAHLIADAGTCSRLKVGAVLVKDRRIISTGYNGAPRGMGHCWHPEDETRPCEVSVHSEVNAIAYAARNGVMTQDSTLYVTDSPCVSCAQLIINAGIKEVKYGKEYRVIQGLVLLKQADIKTEELGEPLLRLVRVVGGDREGLYTRESSDPAFDRGWTERAASHGGGSSGL